MEQFGTHSLTTDYNGNSLENEKLKTHENEMKLKSNTTLIIHSY
jgi:hypothetical protein